MDEDEDEDKDMDENAVHAWQRKSLSSTLVLSDRWPRSIRN